MIEIILMIAFVLFALSIIITFVRILIGPSFPDRVIAMDVVGVNLISAIAIISLLYKTKAFFDVILVLGIIAFISTISFSKFLESGGGMIIERKRDL